MVMNTIDSITLKSLFKQQYLYDDLSSFFYNVWRSDALYKVLMVRRAFNLNYAFLDTIKEIDTISEYSKNLISNYSLLFYAKEISMFYQMMGKFPNILIVDDILIHGRAIYKTIDSLEILLADYLKLDRIEIHSQLLQSINIYVFAESDRKIIMNEDYRIKSYKELGSVNLKVLSKEISQVLQDCSIANTSYVISTKVQEKLEYDENKIGMNLFEYENNKLLYYHRMIVDKYIETIRISPFKNDGLNTFTSLVIFGDIKTEAIDSFCEQIASILESILDYGGTLNTLLHEKHPLLRKPKMQLVSFLLSILSFSDFYKKNISSDSHQVYEALLQSDYQKIATNFLKLERMKNDLIIFIKNVSSLDTINKQMFDVIEKYTKTIVGVKEDDICDSFKLSKNSIKSKSDFGESKIRDIENIFFEKGIFSIRDASFQIKNPALFYPQKRGSDMLSFKSYLERSGIDVIDALGYLFGLMDTGILRMDLEKDDESKVFECVLKAGELSTLFLVKRYSIFIPAFIVIEKHFEKKDEKKGITKIFVEFLDYLTDKCFEADNQIEKSDKLLLNTLKNEITTLMLSYTSGQKFQDWNLDLEAIEKYDLMNFDIQKEKDRLKLFQYELNERKKKYYSFYAKEFIRKHN